GLQRHGEAVPTRWTGFDVPAWRQLRHEALARQAAGRAALQPLFNGSDLDPHAIRAPRRNAARAGAANASGFQGAELSALPAAPPSPRGLVVCNPPYDGRLAADPALYRALGDALKRHVPGWRVALLCGDAELARATGLRAAKKYQVFNGALECTLITVDPIAP